MRSALKRRLCLVQALDTSPVSPLYLPYISHISPLYLPYISPPPRAGPSGHGQDADRVPSTRRERPTSQGAAWVRLRGGLSARRGRRGRRGRPGGERTDQGRWRQGRRSRRRWWRRRWWRRRWWRRRWRRRRWWRRPGGGEQQRRRGRAARGPARARRARGAPRGGGGSPISPQISQICPYLPISARISPHLPGARGGGCASATRSASPHGGRRDPNPHPRPTPTPHPAPNPG